MSPIKPLSLITLATAMACAGCGKSPHKQYEKAGGFSYDPPPGWTVSEFPGMKYKICRGPASDGFAPNINFVDESFSGSLGDYADLNMVNFKKMFAGVKILHRDNLTTNDGQPAIRIALEDEQLKRHLRQTFYFFANGSRKYVATCSTLAEDGDRLEPAFDAAMKTFRMH